MSNATGKRKQRDPSDDNFNDDHLRRFPTRGKTAGSVAAAASANGVSSTATSFAAAGGSAGAFRRVDNDLEYNEEHGSYEDDHHQYLRGTDGEESSDSTASGDDSAVVWDETLHEEFVSAIFEVGLKHASPAVILANMTENHEEITSERVKSKLQKYRNNKVKSKEEFMDEFREFLKRVKAMESTGAITTTVRGSGGGGAASSLWSSSAAAKSFLDMMGTDKLSGGNLAGFLTFTVTKESQDREHQQSGLLGESDGTVLSTRTLERGAREFVDKFSGTVVPCPVLTEAEMNSSLGKAITVIQGVFDSMIAHIVRERTRSKILVLNGRGVAPRVAPSSSSSIGTTKTAPESSEDTRKLPALKSPPGEADNQNLGVPIN